ncbi:acyl-CoA dehydratase activase-related protein [Bifidobacterium asteroides]|uniref:acyl-CoA dehydratase activase-related protein n=1 Tax=Bifidobacterium asteroides TaxID=1684 RepID=UPI0027417B3E|nr:acyl-CoA dehydratase activase-related protein [Bifidobacterium asteroides]WLT11070.1 acyl-CoA dehydratase activase-related protein [Bifidobacterium asteroides]
MSDGVDIAGRYKGTGPRDLLRVGLDIGSTTVKAVVLGAGDRLDQALFSDYRRHHANVRQCVAELVTDIKLSLSRVGLAGNPISLVITGSGGLELASQLQAEFAQEVIAETEAINATYPEGDVIIELGGEDAKITYLKPTPEQRMNGSCAGGTGAFIDQMATLLNTDASGLNDMAAKYKTIYPIASRCGVFAKSDLQPLINDGAAKEDLAASIFNAVATQTISGLACGRPIRGNVIFLGGPLFFMSELREAFKRILQDRVSRYIIPENAHLYVAYGAAIMAGRREQDDQDSAVQVKTDYSPETDVNDPFGPAWGLDQAEVDKARSEKASNLDKMALQDAMQDGRTTTLVDGEHKAPATETAKDASHNQDMNFDLTSLDGVLSALKGLENMPSTARTIRPLFLNEEERSEFNDRHGAQVIPTGDLSGAKGPHFLGIDAGSTTIKAVLINDDKTIVWSTYGVHKDSPLIAAANIVKEVRKSLPEGAYIARACATGYGEGLVKAGLHVDEGVVETMAHYRAAEEISPGVTSVIDIGGQDMKYIAVNDGVIDSICVNEACSAGCGSFLQTFAQSMGISIQEFTKQALASEAPTDLGSRCTVFMNSSVKQAQKEGASPEDIAAGLCYSVVRNALYKVIKLRDANALGPVVVVQGGTFLNDAVLRAFELLTGRKVTRPNIAGLMGAYGAALTARMHCPQNDEVEDLTAAGSHMANGVKSVGSTPTTPNKAPTSTKPKSSPAAVNKIASKNDQGFKATLPDLKVQDGHVVSSILAGDDLDNLSMTTTHDVCKLCQNHCKLTITEFEDGGRYVTGNRCERGGDKNRKRSDRPNLYDFKYKRAFAYRRLTPDKATRGDIGIPRVLNMYEDYPFWFTLLTSLGFRVMISGRSNHELFESGMESIASENICYPAKLVHGHIHSLVDKGIKTIFYPCVTYEQELVPDTDNHYNCPIVANYPVVIEANMAELKENGVRFMRPYFNLSNKEKMVERIVKVFDWAKVSEDEARTAVQEAYREDARFKEDVRQEGLRALAYMQEYGVKGVVLSGRPYHVDPEVNHGIPETICSLGMAVLSEDSICELDVHKLPKLSDYIIPAAGERALASNNPTAAKFRKTVPSFGDDHQKMPLRVTDQWAYHSRLYSAARFVSEYPDLQLVQLVSFGCGVDAITTDQVQEILADKGDVYTQLKIDEVSNLGAAKIRLRSLKAAMDERHQRDVAQENGEGQKEAPVKEQAPAKVAVKDADPLPDLVQAEESSDSQGSQESADRIEAVDANASDKPASDGFRSTNAQKISLSQRKSDIVALARFVALHDKSDQGLIGLHPMGIRPIRETIASRQKDQEVETKSAEPPAEHGQAAQPSGAAAKPTLSKYATEHRFTKEMGHKFTVVAPQMSPVHFSLLEAVFSSADYHFELLKHATAEDINTGVKYVNNDACFPAIIVVGQLVNAFLSGRFDPHKCAVIVTQTGGMCRATNYYGLLRKALADAGYGYVPIITLSVQGFKANPGLQVTPALLHRAVKAFYLGDAMIECLLRVRPYEQKPGSANRLYKLWDTICKETIEHHGYSKTAKKVYGHGYLPYRTLMKRMIRAFDQLPLRNIPRKPRVGVVGEILVKYHPDANNHVVDLIESQGCEAVLPGVCDFMVNGISNAEWNEEMLGTGGPVGVKKIVLKAADAYRAPMIAGFKASHGKFDIPAHITDLRDKAASVTSLGVQAGEGWLLTGEIIELIQSGAPNIVCAQPFACLPNHVTGRGMFGKIRRTYPEANIVSIDYDPGASEANQLNRIKLMIAAAKKPGGQQKLSQDHRANVESQASGSTGRDAGQAAPVQDEEKVLESL